MAESGYVYLMRRSSDGAYKIGYSANPNARLQRVRYEFDRNGSVEIVHLIKTDDMRSLENMLHHLYAHRSIASSRPGSRGIRRYHDKEFFALTQQDVQEICSISDLCDRA